ncbi:MAG: hypothetical protein ABIB47_01230 [Candidatus Woesearchaeota archaeon]
MSDEETKILNKLFVDEEDTLEKLNELISKAGKLFSIHKKTARVELKEPKKLIEKEKICLLLMGRYFSAHEKIKIIDSDSLSGSSIIQELKGNAGTIWGKLSELNSEGLIEKTKEGYKIIPYKIEQILNTILEDYDTRNIKQIKPKKVKQKKSKSKIDKTKDPILEKLENKLDRTSYSILHDLKNDLDRALLMLKIAKEDGDIDGLTASQISNLLISKFRVPSRKESISMALNNKKATKMVDRTKSEIGYKYKIMQGGLNYLEELNNPKENEQE